MPSARPSLLPALTLRQVQHLVVLAHARSFTQAAQALSLTQPALTASIRQVEFLLGGQLFTRSAHRLTLTAAGEAVLPLAERLLNQARGTLADMTQLVSERIQTVRVAFIPSVAGRLLPALNALRDTDPTLRFTLTDLPNSALVDAVRNGVADIGIGAHAPGRDDGLHYEPLFEDEIVAVLRRDDPLARAKSTRSVPWAKLVDRELAAFLRGSVADALERTAHAEQLHLNVTYRMEYTEPLYALARNGLAVAILPSLYTRHLHDPELIALSLTKPRVSRAISLISLAGDDRGPHVRTCRDWIVRHI